uniref:c-type cytochrome n=1 Tax=Bradyrhizobium sp. (strain ORS 278) TaxID=114615 RepID=UPI001FCA859B|nr:cytochrome c [Bradyrhizobium sp. ORS 278]
MKHEKIRLMLKNLTGRNVKGALQTGKISARWSAIAAAMLACIAPVFAQSAAPAPQAEPFDVQQLFASSCGWCHSDAGRVAGKGPQLMDTQRSDDFIRNRIKVGKPGAMPAFGEAFTDVQIDAIIAYIRALKPD